MNLEIYDSDIESVKLSIRSRSEAPLKPVWPLAGLLMPWKKLGNLGMFYSLYKTLDSSYDHLKDRRKLLLPKGQAGIKAAKYLLKKLPGYQLRSLIEGSPLERLLSKSGTISTKLLRDYFAANASTVEKDVVAKALQELFAGLDKVDYNDFRQAVLKSLIGPYTRVPLTEWADYGMDGLGFKTRMWSDGESIAYNDVTGEFELVAPFKLFVPSYQLNTFTFESPRIPYGNTKHYSGNPLGHSRTYTLTEDPHTLYVMESQSDWALKTLRKKDNIDAQSSYERASLRAAELLQEIELMKANLEKGLAPDGHKIQHEWERRDIEEIIKTTGKQLADNNARAARFDAILHPEKYILENYLKQNYLQRQLQENLRYAAEGRWTKMRYPTPETAAKIEGYKKETAPRPTRNREIELRDLLDKMWKEYYDANESQLSNASLLELELIGRKNIPNYAKITDELELLRNIPDKYEYIPAHQTILKKYADFPKLFLKLFKDLQVRTVTDAKGNTWYEVDVPNNYLLREWPFKNGGILKYRGGNEVLDPELSKTIIHAAENNINKGVSKDGKYYVAYSDGVYNPELGRGTLTIGDGVAETSDAPKHWFSGKRIPAEEVDAWTYNKMKEGVLAVKAAYDDRFGTKLYPNPSDTISPSALAAVASTRYKKYRLGSHTNPILDALKSGKHSRLERALSAASGENRSSRIISVLGGSFYNNK